jgi:hypothetical protein
MTVVAKVKQICLLPHPYCCILHPLPLLVCVLREGKELAGWGGGGYRQYTFKSCHIVSRICIWVWNIGNHPSPKQVIIFLPRARHRFKFPPNHVFLYAFSIWIYIPLPFIFSLKRLCLLPPPPPPGERNLQYMGFWAGLDEAIIGCEQMLSCGEVPWMDAWWAICCAMWSSAGRNITTLHTPEQRQIYSWIFWFFRNQGECGTFFNLA